MTTALPANAQFPSVAPAAVPPPLTPPPAVKPLPAKRPVAKPAAGPRPPKPPAAVPVAPPLEERLQHIENALSNAGIAEPKGSGPSVEQLAKKQDLEKKLEGINRQNKVLEEAVKNGLAPEAAKPSFEKLQAERAATQRELANIEVIPPPGTPNENLTLRLNRIEQELGALKTPPPPPPPTKAAAPPPPPPPNAPQAAVEEKPLAGYYDKKFSLRSADDKFTLGFTGHLQARLAYTGYAEELDKKNDLAFLIPRSRFGISGNVYGKGNTYNFLLELGKGSPTLLDSWLEFEAIPKQLYVRVGQMKKPFSRQQITSSATYQFTDPASTDKNFGAGYDIGIMLHDRFDKSPTFEWGVGVFNGSGNKSNFTSGTVTGTATTDATGSSTVKGSVAETASFSNVPKRFRPTVVARIGYNTPDLKGYSESDLEGGAARFGVAGSVQREFDFDENDTSNLRAEVDSIVKVQGFSATGGAYLGWLENLATYGNKNTHYEGFGWHAQAGYVIAKLVEPVVRWDGFSKDGPYNNVQSLLFGTNVFLSGHKLKFDGEIGPQFEQWTNPKDASDHSRVVSLVGRLQAQLAF